tara:strand:+ start:157 stop:915 length:759 start_codon:yes stop_codon:yes gene_type:complete
MTKNNIVGLVAVRLNSKRLEKKAFLSLYYKKLIHRLVERIKNSKYLNYIAICTTTHKLDNSIADFAKKNKIKVFRGSEKDVMSRFILAGKKLNADHVVRITGDNPLTDPKIMDSLIKCHLKNNNEYTYSSSVPIGTSSEIIKFDALIKCYKYLIDPNSSEYMTWMLNRPDVFKVEDVLFSGSLLKFNNINFTVDEENEYLNLKKIYNNYKGNLPSLTNIIDWVVKSPNLYVKMTKQKKLKRIKNINCKFKFD